MSRAVLALASALVFVVLSPLAAAPSGAAEGSEAASALGNEEIVRMVTSGVSEADILEAIRERAPAYDVSDDMLDELKLAGVPPAIIAAMKARAAQVAPSAPPPERPRKGTTRLVVEFGTLGAHTLRAPAFADENVKARLHLSKELADREIHDLAVFLACTRAEHVPDLWRQKTPLGRDMSLDARHEMLAFIPGDTPAGKKPRLALPARIEADVDDTEPHDLVLGVAALIGDHWVQVAVGVLRDVMVPPGAAPLSARISSAPAPLVYTVALAAPAK